MSRNLPAAGEAYWAFLSYSHKDADFGRRLHRQLETYALPGRLVGRETPRGCVPGRLTPIFRDHDELPAASDLSAEVRAALGQSRTLIVVCSAAAAASPWVGREIELFRKLHPDRPILAAIHQGEPPAIFPALLRRTDAGGETLEPLAADFRAGQEGARLARLKLVAGITGLRFDELVQRDAQRAFRSVMAVTSASIVLALLFAGLAAYAFHARTEAQQQRADAEGLVEFMLTDLRAKLKGVGRLDAMTAVDARALRYYARQNPENLSPDSLERRARILHATGEDDEELGNDRAALGAFQEARDTTSALLESAPNDPERIFTHAQSEYWIGYHNYRQGRYFEARRSFQAYRRLAYHLVSLAPQNPLYLREAGFAEGDICSVDLKEPRDVPGAMRSCSAALQYMERAAGRLGWSPMLDEDVGNRHGWLSDAYRASGDYARALNERLAQEHLLSEARQAEPGNMDLKNSWVALQRILAWMECWSGNTEAAIGRLMRAIAISDQLVAFDTSNKDWATQRAALDSDITRIHSVQTRERVQ